MPVVVGARLASGIFIVTLAVLLYRAQPLLINVQGVYTATAALVIALAGVLVIINGAVEVTGAVRRS